ncbi:MAG: DUF3592 domain-containing protein [Kiritimatiellaeota bacterium]|nr:DUF3592 domain-containing protein [Kiritimatiellota bacterium]
MVRELANGVAGVVFGLMFFGVGVGMGGWSLYTLLEARAMERWEEVPAQIVACALESHTGDKGSAAYAVTATYRYTVGDVDYEGRRVGLMGGSDNIGTFQQDTHRILKTAMDTGESVPCRVNPASPGDAILFWTPRLDVLMVMQIFVFVFGGIGFAVLWSIVFLRHSTRPEGGRIRMEGVGARMVVAVMAVAFGAYAIALLGLVVGIVGMAQYPWWGYAPLVPVGIMAGAAVILQRRFNAFGVSVLELSPCPAVAGQALRGTVHVPCRFEPGTDVVATLRYVHQYTRGSGKSRRTHTDIVWKDAKPASVYVAGESMSAVRVEWELANRDHVSTAKRNRDGHWWELSLAAKRKGLNYKAVFDIPVSQPQGV